LLVVHPHFHRRRTGVTRHVETVVRAQAALCEAKAIGWGLEPGVPSLSWTELWTRFRREPLIWHAHRNLELLLGLALRALGRKVRVVFTRHSASPPGHYTRWLARAADARVALTAEVADRLALPADIIGHGIELDRFAPPEDRAASWSALGLGGARGIAVIGRIRPQKGQGDFLRAVAPLLPQHSDWRAALVGEVKPADRAWLHSENASVRVPIIDEREGVERWYRGLTILVQPSHSEGFSLVLLEALAAGCCVVAARLPHFPALIDDGRTGFLYPPGDVEALRKILASLMSNPQKADEIGRNAARSARERFGVRREAEALLRLYSGS
jgi:mannosyltransferase